MGWGLVDVGGRSGGSVDDRSGGLVEAEGWDGGLVEAEGRSGGR